MSSTKFKFFWHTLGWWVVNVFKKPWKLFAAFSNQVLIAQFTGRYANVDTCHGAGLSGGRLLNGYLSAEHYIAVITTANDL